MNEKKSGWIYAVANSDGEEADKRVGLFGRSIVGKIIGITRTTTNVSSRRRRDFGRSSERNGRRVLDVVIVIIILLLLFARMPVKYISGDVR